MLSLHITGCHYWVTIIITSNNRCQYITICHWGLLGLPLVINNRPHITGAIGWPLAIFTYTLHYYFFLHLHAMLLLLFHCHYFHINIFTILIIILIIIYSHYHYYYTLIILVIILLPLSLHTSCGAIHTGFRHCHYILHITTGVIIAMLSCHTGNTYTCLIVIADNSCCCQ